MRCARERGRVTGIWQPIIELILASLVIMGSPGPSTISVTAMGAAFGFRRSLPYAFGLVFGTTAVLGIVSAGVFTIILSIPHGAQVFGAVSAVYLLYLAFRIATAPPLQSPHGTGASPSFLAGFLLAIANPKAYLAIAAVFAGSTIFADHARDTVAKLTLLSVMIVIIHAGWLAAGASLARALGDPRWSRVINVCLAALLVVMTWLAWAG